MPADPRIVSGDELMTLIEAAFGRLDIALADSNTLRRAKQSQRDQLLHWTAWRAFHPSAASTTGTEAQRPGSGTEPGGAETDRPS